MHIFSESGGCDPSDLDLSICVTKLSSGEEQIVSIRYPLFIKSAFSVSLLFLWFLPQVLMVNKKTGCDPSILFVRCGRSRALVPYIGYPGIEPSVCSKIAKSEALVEDKKM